MIYRNSYFRKELRQSYTDNKTSTSRKLAFALFSGLISFALYFLLQTLQESVLSDVVPEIMQPSFFSTIYIYIHIAFFLNVSYFMIYYDYLFLSEIRKNSWYLLVQMNYNPVSMFFSKFFALVFSVVWTYSVGFASMVLLTVFLKYNLILAYMPSLYLSGLIDLILITLFTMMISLYTKTVINARYLTLLSAVFIFLLKIVSGFYSILSNRVTMQNINNLSDVNRSGFIPIALTLMAVSSLICVFKARKTSQYYSSETDDSSISEGVKVVRLNLKTGKTEPVDRHRRISSNGKQIDMIVSVLLIILICTMLIFNVLVVLINATTPGNEVFIWGVIPYIFKSETMKPDIMLNDLAYFQKIDQSYTITVGRIIIFKQDNIVLVERVIQVNEDQLTVDIDYYPSIYQIGAMQQTIPKEAVIGVFVGRNRWLGALILFANTIFGRLLFLLVPTILLFYHRQILYLFGREKIK
ncbi:MAG: S26 family signal peptidase [Clostridiaceae bacterium]|nr:S26 family signal peptidase [Clostridiaceae bacterium]